MAPNGTGSPRGLPVSSLRGDDCVGKYNSPGFSAGRVDGRRRVPVTAKVCLYDCRTCLYSTANLPPVRSNPSSDQTHSQKKGCSRQPFFQSVSLSGWRCTSSLRSQSAFPCIRVWSTWQSSFSGVYRGRCLWQPTDQFSDAANFCPTGKAVNRPHDFHEILPASFQ